MAAHHNRGRTPGRVARCTGSKELKMGLETIEFIPIMVYWASYERRHHVWPV
jgi:hypothetical protein